MKASKEWLTEEGFENYDTIERIPPYKEESSNYITATSYSLDILMERFANYRTKELQAKILLFSQWIIEKWNESETGYINGAYLLEAFKKHFGITEARNGTL